MFQRCLICTDFSDGLYRLTDFVANLAAGGVRQVVFLHCVPIWDEGEVPRIDQEKIDTAKERFSNALKDVPEGIEVCVEVPSGRPTDAIPEVLKKYDSDVVLTGMPIRSLLQEKIFGSTSLALAKCTSTPIMMLRPQLVSTYTREELALRCEHLWRYLLIPYNDGSSARYLLEQFKEYVQKRPDNSLKQCMLLWVIDEARRKEIPSEYRVKEAQKKLESVKSELEGLGLEVNAEVREGNPFMEIIDVAVEYDISAIATSYVTKGKLLDWTAPSFANEVLRRSWFPVLFFSPKQ
ncbi:universal stress protein [Lusitaniella coriacea LEGE 07157]|uniref:Universal stress protein n=1 Tax=Lusitaniella coriacea LEGE 07157 TaxID=945747 RepID=A0A8J7E6B7_9CYAN|nr:universal stress protein [Lusitaniella coriacea]MBE9119084.1 universal stress protein [Lusitaniella coriacea LEGE 07157]